MIFCELLPPQCPPTDADDGPLVSVYRVLAGSNPAPSDWESYLQKGKPCPKTVDLCRWGSLSLQSSKVAAQKLKKLPNFRGATHAAKISIPKNMGKHKQKKSHYDFWPTSVCDPSQFIDELVEI